MPFDKRLYEGYCVGYSEKKRREDKAFLFACFAVLWVCVFASCIFNGIEEGWNHAAVGLLFCLLLGGLLLRWRSKPEPESMKIWVQGNTFCTEMNVQRSRVFRFSEITRVSYHSRHGRMHKVNPLPYWGIYVGEECVAAFRGDMENAQRLLKSLDELGMITPYGTGMKAQ